ncbi:unnamed protein product [Sphenostylis stenocarpa]|uniref:Myosin N-terminal SH3-like domain-containing protein n=1 Tax=Sphenostylis stenocarpa TaxID=92480 RepID=A0AA86S395_9FABA|nr:unnamed protein product [Sphenostylis stenocarpa]
MSSSKETRVDAIEASDSRKDWLVDSGDAIQVSPATLHDGQLNYVVGSHVWVEDPDLAWIDGEIQESNKNGVTIRFESGTRVVSKSVTMYPKDPEFPHNGVKDMTRLAYLHEPGVLHNLQIRYSANDIYVTSFE